MERRVLKHTSENGPIEEEMADACLMWGLFCLNFSFRYGWSFIITCTVCIPISTLNTVVDPGCGLSDRGCNLFNRGEVVKWNHCFPLTMHILEMYLNYYKICGYILFYVIHILASEASDKTSAIHNIRLKITLELL